MADNSYLLVISTLEGAINMINIDSRKQLDRSTLTVCGTYLDMCIQQLTNLQFTDTFTLGYIVDSKKLITAVLELDNFKETDVETKTLLHKNLSQAVEALYTKVGVYYDTHPFEYNMRLDPLLMRIVDKCILSGYFFGVEKEI